MTELSFTAARDYADPFDLEQVCFGAAFDGPGGVRLTIPGFWDGGRTWKVRFTPTAAGQWRYRTYVEKAIDEGLAGQQGTLDVAPAPAEGENPLRVHGGFLKVSADGRYLTYADGTPFFWLGDTWWNVPSANVPMENFTRMVDQRVAQGYTVFQAHGHRAIMPAGKEEVGAFEAIRGTRPAVVEYWRRTDRYYDYAAAKGIVGVVGFSGHSGLDKILLEDLQRLWHYYIARYGAYPITFLITQEYNALLGDAKQRIPKLLALGRYIHQTDPYQRAMTVHPWSRSHDTRDAWPEPWMEFIMQQGGHNHVEKPSVYHDIYFGPVRKPLVEAEANYEGFETPKFKTDAAVMRQAAYTAIQSGCCGYTYGAQGLYAGVLAKTAPLTTANWGPVLTWEEGLALSGGAQMAHVRALYGSLPWWTLEPRPSAVTPPAAGVLVKASADAKVCVLYFPPLKKEAPAPLRLSGLPAGQAYKAFWFDPRSGDRKGIDPQTSGPDGLALSPRPDLQDWLLVLASP